MVNKYLFKITTELDQWGRWHDKKAKPVYFVAESYKEARIWAEDRLSKGLKVKGITCIAEQIGGHVFSGAFSDGKPKKEVISQ